MKKRHWTPAEDTAIRDLYPTQSAYEIGEILNRSARMIWNRASELGIKKPREAIAERARKRSNDPNHGSRATRFQPGLTPWNKGKPFHAGGRSVDTQFKPGKPRTGKAAALYRHVGSLRINADGYIDRKINDDKPYYKRWKGEHLVIWEAANGPVPAGCAVIFKDGNKRNFDLDNLELITRREMMLRNTVHRHGPEIAGLSQLRGALKRQINRRARREQPGEPS